MSAIRSVEENKNNNGDIMIWSDYFVYDETSPSGLCWKIDRNHNVKAGDIAGGVNNKAGRWRVKLTSGGTKKHYSCYRIVWELHNGVIPIGMVIDHIDGDLSNNKINNLRAVTNMINSRNVKKSSRNKSGVVGVRKIRDRKGGVNDYFAAQWQDSTRKQCYKLFNINKLGHEEAMRQASAYRQKMLEELGDYTDRHGK